METGCVLQFGQLYGKRGLWAGLKTDKTFPPPPNFSLLFFYFLAYLTQNVILFCKILHLSQFPYSKNQSNFYDNFFTFLSCTML